MADYFNNNSISSQQKSLIAAAFLLALIASLVFFMLTGPTYHVKASILIQTKDTGIPEIDQFVKLNYPEVSNMVQKLKSVNLLQETLEKLGYNYPPDSMEFTQIRKKLRVKQIPYSNVIEISLSYNSLAEATKIVNTLGETLMQNDLKERREKIRQALDSIQTALDQVQADHTQVKPPAANVISTNRNAVDNYLKEVNDDLYRTTQKLLDLKKDLSQRQIGIINETFDPMSLNRFKSTLNLAEKQLVRYLLAGGWNSPNVKQQMVHLWKEKSRIAATLKEQLNLRLDIPIHIIENICAYEIRNFDLQIRKQELIRLISTTPPNPMTRRSVKGVNKPYESLKELEVELLEKQTILQSLNDLTLAKISWIDKAFPVKPILRSNLLIILGLCLGIAVVAALIVGLLCVEYNSYKRGI